MKLAAFISSCIKSQHLRVKRAAFLVSGRERTKGINGLEKRENWGKMRNGQKEAQIASSLNRELQTVSRKPVACPLSPLPFHLSLLRSLPRRNEILPLRVQLDVADCMAHLFPRQTERSGLPRLKHRRAERQDKSFAGKLAGKI